MDEAEELPDTRESRYEAALNTAGSAETPMVINSDDGSGSDSHRPININDDSESQSNARLANDEIVFADLSDTSSEDAIGETEEQEAK